MQLIENGSHMKILSFCSPLLIAGISLLASCNRPNSGDKESEVKQTGSDLLEVKQEAKDGYFEELQRFKQNQAIKLNEIENRIETYKTSMSKDQAQSAAHKDVTEAEHKVTVLRKKLEEFSEEGTDKLIKFEQDFSKDMLDLNQTLNKFTTQLKS